MKLHKYTEEKLKHAVLTSTSMRQVLIKLDVSPFGGNYDVLRKAIKNFDLDTSHFTGQGWNKGTQQPRREIKDYLNNKHQITSHKLRLRLLKENIFPHKCMACNRKTWLGRPIPLELEHVDGNNKNNKLTNLQLLCPNCHALTSTYRGKNKKSPSA